MTLRRRIALLAWLALPAAAEAADFTATRFDDPVPDGCTPTDCSLREAVIAAQAAPGADRVLLPAGTFQLTYDEDLELSENNTGPLLLDTPIEIVGAGRTATTLMPAPNLPLVIAVSLESTPASVTLSDFTIANFAPVELVFGPIMVGEAGTLILQRFGMRANTAQIAGVFSAGQLTVLDSVFEQNTASGPSSGVVVFATRGPIAISGTQFIDNTTSNGALLITDFLDAPLGDVRLRNNLFRGNLADAFAAGLTLRAGAGLNRVDLSDSVFEDNHSAVDAGAAFLGYSEDAASTTRLQVTADGTRFTGNEADGRCGALLLDAPDALGLIEAPMLTLDLARFENNIAGGAGGALCTGGAAEITRSTFEGNSAGNSGGAILHNGASLSVSQSTFSGNSAGSSGGAIAASAPMDIRRSTFDGNDADTSGGALHLSGGGESLLRHVTLYGNTAADSANAVRVLYGTDTVLRFDNSILQGGCSANNPSALTDSQQNVESPGDTCGLGLLNNSRNVALAALALGPLADNGGPTLTRMPQPGSVALNRVIVIPSCTVEDQRGYVGTGGNCDSGAVEAAAIPSEPLPPDMFSDGFE